MPHKVKKPQYKPKVFDFEKHVLGVEVKKFPVVDDIASGIKHQVISQDSVHVEPHFPPPRIEIKYDNPQINNIQTKLDKLPQYGLEMKEVANLLNTNENAGKTLAANSALKD